ncbi:MAG: sigma 54-interacting transcriptional regulator [Planctomycetes bacterium]|nr:sigma 54-interacting transcriptional regulator [Planctomycetota bacterium]
MTADRMGRLFGRYEVEREIGRGGTGRVFLARDEGSRRRRVAIKVLDPECAGDPSARATLRNEFRTLATLRHPGLARVFDYGTDDESGAVYLVEEFVRGEDLSCAAPKLAAADVRSLFVKAARALDAIHRRGLVHFDVKPENLLVVAHGRKLELKLVDFGIAGARRGAASNRPLAGTRPYVAPEAWRGEAVDGRADLFALGVTFFRAIVGRFPDGPDDGGAPAWLRAVLPRLLDPEPARRFANARELIEAVNRASAGRFRVETTVERREAIRGGPFVGRGRQIESLLRLARSCGQGKHRAALVIVRGPSGSGRSRLLSELRVACRLRHVHVIGESARDRTAGPFPILGAWIRETAAAGVPRSHPSIPALRAIAPEVFGKSRDADRTDLASKGGEGRVRDAVVAWLRDALGDRPTVLLADDLDASDSQTLDVVSLLVRLADAGLGMAPILVVATFGREASRVDSTIRALRDRGLVHEMRLAPLGASDVARFIAGQLGADARRLRTAVVKLARALVARTGGNPGTVEETLRFLLDARRSDLVTLLESARGDVPIIIPAALRSSWRERIASLDALERKVLLGLALAGRPTPLDFLEDPDAGVASTRLAARGLVEGRDGAWTVPAGTLADAMLEVASDDEARPLHAALARSLRGSRRDDVSMDLARHLLGAAIGGDARAARLAAASALRAARERWSREAPAEGETVLRALLDATLAVPERTTSRARIFAGDLLAAQGEHDRALAEYREGERAIGTTMARTDRRIGEACREQGEYAEAESRLVRALASTDLVEGSTERARAILALGMTRLLLGRPADAAAAARSALESPSARHMRPRAAAHLWNLVGMAAFRCGDTRECERAYTKALKRFDATDDAAGSAGVLNNLAVLRTQEGKFAEAARLHGKALALFERRGNVAQEAMTRNNLGLTAIARGDLAAAREALEQSLHARRALGDSYGEASSLGNLGVGLREEGRLADARAALRESRRRFAALGNRREEALILAHLAHLEVDLGRPREASGLARKALDGLEAADFPRERAVALVAASRAALEGRDARTARQRLEEAIPLATTAFSKPWSARAAGFLVEEALRRSDLDAARAALVVARRAVVGTDLRDMRARLALDAAEISRLEGRRQAPKEIERAARLAAKSERAEVRLRALSSFGEVLLDGGDATAAARVLGEASGVVEAMTRGLAPTDARRVRARPAHARIARLLAAARGRAVEGGGSTSKRFASLVDINRRLLSEPDPEKLLGVILDAAIEVSGAERGFVILRGAAGLTFPVARNFEKRDLERASAEVSHAFVKRVLDTGRTWASEDTGADERLRRSRSLLDLGAASLVAVPLRAAGGGSSTLGALYLDHRREAGLFAGEARALLEALADQAALALEIRRRQREIEELNRRLEAGLEEKTQELQRVRTELRIARRSMPRGKSDVTWRSVAMRAIADVVERVAPTNLTVAIVGESGSGKDAVARTIHAQSRRAEKPFVAVDCATLPEPLVEAELFGHRKGAFTGADRDRKGLFETASGGTLYLDGVTALSPSAQSKILRAIEAGEVRPVGSTSFVRVNVRLVVSSTQPLADEVARGRFREDLLFRLEEVVVRVPPLRERREDIPSLVDAFLAEALAGEARKRRTCRFSKEAMARLLDYPWPGNVRELRNEVRRAVLLGDAEIRTAVLSPEVRAGGGAMRATEPVTAEGFREALREAESVLVRRALQAANGNQSRAAKLLGLSRFGLRKKMSRLGIAPPEPTGA